MNDYEYKELSAYKGYGMTRAYQLNDEGKKIPGTTIYLVSEGEDYIGEEYKTLIDAKKYVDGLNSNNKRTNKNMMQIVFHQKAIRKEISDNQVLYVRINHHKYNASVFNKISMETEYSNAYVRVGTLNKNFLSKYGVELVVD